MAITRYMDSDCLPGKHCGAAKRKSNLPGYWRADADAYCVTVVRTMLQMIGNLILGFNGTGVYVLDGVESEIGGEAVLLFDLAGAKAIA
jgi:hypothetical protein